MRRPNRFSDLAIEQAPEKIELEIFKSDFELLQTYKSYKEQTLGGKLKVAQIIQRAFSSLFDDPDFARHMGVQSKRRKPAPKQSLKKET